MEIASSPANYSRSPRLLSGEVAYETGRDHVRFDYAVERAGEDGWVLVGVFALP